jgi:hypothetical protein
MANSLYDNYRALCMGGGEQTLPNLGTGDVRVAIVDLTVDYTFSATTHDTKDDVTSYTGSTDVSLTDQDIATAEGTFDSDDTPTYSSLSQSASKTVGAVVHYDFQTADATSPLICYHDNFTAVVPNGGDIVINYNASGIFTL